VVNATSAVTATSSRSRVEPHARFPNRYVNQCGRDGQRNVVTALLGLNAAYALEARYAANTDSMK
jgi:hypothetical protein